MNLRQVEIFLRVFEAGSVTRAAEAVGISQPAVSKHLATLERSCGFKLFHRTGGRIVPTAEAKLFALEVERLFANVQHLDHIATSIAERRRGSVRIAAFPALAHRFAPKALAPILADRPDVHLSLQSRTSPRVVELAINQQIDVGFSLLPAEHPLVDCVPVCAFDLVCVLPRDHRLAAKQSLTPEDLKDEPFISLGGEDRSRTVIDDAFGLKFPRSRMQIEAQMGETACSFVASGLGVAIVSPFTIEGFEGKEIVARRFRPAIEMTVWQMTPTVDPTGIVTHELAACIGDALIPYRHGRGDAAGHSRAATSRNAP